MSQFLCTRREVNDDGIVYVPLNQTVGDDIGEGEIWTCSSSWMCMGMVICFASMMILWLVLWCTCCIRHRSMYTAHDKSCNVIHILMAFVPFWRRVEMKCADASHRRLRKRRLHTPTSFHVFSMKLAGQPESGWIHDAFRCMPGTWTLHRDGHAQWMWGMVARQHAVAVTYKVDGATMPVYRACIRPSRTLTPHTLPPLPRDVYWDAQAFSMCEITHVWWIEHHSATAWTAVRMPTDITDLIRSCFGPQQLHRELGSVHDWTANELDAFFTIRSLLSTSIISSSSSSRNDPASAESQTTTLSPSEKRNDAKLIKKITASISEADTRPRIVLRSRDATELCLVLSAASE